MRSTDSPDWNQEDEFADFLREEREKAHLKKLLDKEELLDKGTLSQLEYEEAMKEYDNNEEALNDSTFIN